MTNPHQIDEVTAWIEALLETSGGPPGHRVLLDAVDALGVANACAVWRRVRPEGGGRGCWRPALERGPADALPSASQIEALLEGRLRWSLPHRGTVLRVENSGLGVALVLGEPGPEAESKLDSLEALMWVWMSVERARPDELTKEPGEWTDAPLPPRSAPDSRESGGEVAGADST